MGIFRPRTHRVTVEVHEPHPISVAMASVLGTLHGRGIKGDTGTVLIGMVTPSGPGKYSGYVNPQQLFTGWNPRKVAGGAIRSNAQGLPGTQAPPGYQNPLLNALYEASKKDQMS